MDYHLHNLGLLEARQLIIEGTVPMSYGLQGVDEVDDDFGQGEPVLEDGLRKLGYLLGHELPSFILAQNLHLRQILIRQDDGGSHDGLLEVIDFALRGCVQGRFNFQHLAIFEFAFIWHCGRSQDGVDVVLVVKALPENIHVKHPEEAAPEAIAKGGIGLPGEGDCGVSKDELFQTMLEHMYFFSS